MARNKSRTKEEELEIRLRWSNRRIRHFEQVHKHLEEVAYYDELTRESAVLTRFGFLKRMESRLTEVDDRNRRGEARQNCLLYLDLDDFKCINDRYGHQVGDLIIKGFAAAVQSTLRGSDILGRVGGDEFAVMARVRGVDGVNRLKARVHQAIAVASVVHKDIELPIKASIGATILNPGDSVERILDRADQLMYQDKASRRKNR